MQRTKLKDRILPTYTKGEEIFNMVTHIVGGALGIVALILCIIFIFAVAKCLSITRHLSNWLNFIT